MTSEISFQECRYKWQEKTQKEVLNNLLGFIKAIDVHKSKKTKLVMVFGNSHSGKTTLILSLMGIKNDRLKELNNILRAGIPKGESSTSTSIFYHKCETNEFGILERKEGDNDSKIEKCTSDEIEEKLSEKRKCIESHKYDKDIQLHIFIPKEYFDESCVWDDSISIMDLPGFETTNINETPHSQALFIKYMSMAALCIIVRTINDINDLGQMELPNGDGLNDFLSSRYIIVTTRSYSDQSIFRYFSNDRTKRNNSFCDYVDECCSRELHRIFGSKIPCYYAVDIGDSFDRLIEDKLSNEDDKNEVVEYRKNIFSKITNKIEESENKNLFSWIKELNDWIEEEKIREEKVCDDYIRASEENQKSYKKQIERRGKLINEIEKCEKEISNEQLMLKHMKENIIGYFENANLDAEVENYLREENADYDDCEVLFIELYRKQIKKIRTDIEDIGERDSDLFHEVMDSNLNEVLSELLHKHEEKVINQLYSTNWREWTDWIGLISAKYREKKKNSKLKYGRKCINDSLSECSQNLKNELICALDRKISDNESIRKSKKNSEHIMKKNQESDCKKIQELVKIKEDYTKEKERIVAEFQKNKELCSRYLDIAKEQYLTQKNEIISEINRRKVNEITIKFLLVLALMENDYNTLLSMQDD